jgi:hypothetical protein
MQTDVKYLPGLKAVCFISALFDCSWADSS